MALVYFDSSALVKLLVEEPGSDLAAQLWDGCDAALSSRIANPEVRATLGAAARNHTLSPARLRTVRARWRDLWAATRPIELSKAVEQHAGDLSERHNLKGADAVHLASALALGTTLHVAVWDRRLHTAARVEGLAVAPASLDR